MITFLCGLMILILGYMFYAPYVQKQFVPTDAPTPAQRINDKRDFVPIKTSKVALIQLLNIAGIGPLLGAVQGILFGPVAFILIPLGCVIMGGVHDYFSGMISVRDNGLQVTGLIKKYLGEKAYFVFIIVVSLMLLLLSATFVYTSGDLIAERFLGVTDFSLTNPVMITIYSLIVLYFLMATLFPVDKIIGNIYPIFGFLLLFGTGAILAGFLFHGITLQEFDIRHINLNPNNLSIIPFFFMTVSCGLLSGFHSTQSTIVSRTLNSEFEGKKVFYGMMCLESLIAMIWAAGAMHVYSHNLVPIDMVGKANVLNIITNNFVPYYVAFLVTSTIVILPITSGDTALRSLRLTIAEALNFKQSSIKNCLIITIPSVLLMIGVLYVAKMDNALFFLVWRYFTFVNQLIAVLTFAYASVFLYKSGKNYFITLIPAIFFAYVTSTFILNAKIGFNLSLNTAKVIAVILTLLFILWIVKKMQNFKKMD